MRVSAKTDYALRALLEMSSRTDSRPVSAEELGRLQDIPHGFLQAILADLRKAGVVIAQRGQSGGWRMNRDPGDVSVADVIRAVDGPLVCNTSGSLLADRCERSSSRSAWPTSPPASSPRLSRR
jgi:Rrf2 family protein